MPDTAWRPGTAGLPSCPTLQTHRALGMMDHTLGSLLRLSLDGSLLLPNCCSMLRLAP